MGSLKFTQENTWETIISELGGLSLAEFVWGPQYALEVFVELASVCCPQHVRDWRPIQDNHPSLCPAHSGTDWVQLEDAWFVYEEVFLF